MLTVAYYWVITVSMLELSAALSFGAWMGGRSKLTDVEFKILKLAYEEFLESLDFAIESNNVEDVQRYTLLRRDLEDLAERQGRKLEPKPPPLPTT